MIWENRNGIEFAHGWNDVDRETLPLTIHSKWTQGAINHFISSSHYKMMAKILNNCFWSCIHSLVWQPKFGNSLKKMETRILWWDPDLHQKLFFVYMIIPWAGIFLCQFVVFIDFKPLVHYKNDILRKIASWVQKLPLESLCTFIAECHVCEDNSNTRRGKGTWGWPM